LAGLALTMHSVNTDDVTGTMSWIWLKCSCAESIPGLNWIRNICGQSLSHRSGGTLIVVAVSFEAVWARGMVEECDVISVVTEFMVEAHVCNRHRSQCVGDQHTVAGG
jgi:hypothetical protein